MIKGEDTALTKGRAKTQKGIQKALTDNSAQNSKI